LSLREAASAGGRGIGGELKVNNRHLESGRHFGKITLDI
jgi:hypothetical protein